MRNVGFSWNGWLFPAECFLVGHFWRTPRDQGIDLVRPEGFEPPTLGLEAQRDDSLLAANQPVFAGQPGFAVVSTLFTCIHFYARLLDSRWMTSTRLDSTRNRLRG
jgi:hypothetical protein